LQVTCRKCSTVFIAHCCDTTSMPCPTCGFDEDLGLSLHNIYEDRQCLLPFEGLKDAIVKERRLDGPLSTLILAESSEDTKQEKML